MSQALDAIRRKVESGERLTEDEFEQLRAAAQAQPGPTLRLTVAHALINAGDERSALVLLERLVRDFPRDLQCWLGLARAHVGLDRKGDAERALKEALALSPGDPEALKVLATLAMQRGEFARARQLVADVLRVDPFDDEARLLKTELESAHLPPPDTAQNVALRPEFTRALLQALRARGVQAVAKDDTLLVRPRGVEEPARVNLASLYAGYLNEAGPLTESVRRIADGLVAAALGMPREAAELLERTLPVLRPGTFREVAPGAAAREGPAGLLVFYVIDDPALVRYVPHGSLAARGVTLQALDDAAFRNLEARPGPLRQVTLGAGQPVWAVHAEDGHDAARLLCASQRAAIERTLGPGPWRVDLGRRECVPIAREQDADAMARLEALGPEADGIPGRFRLREDGVLERLS